jgi:thiamine pyrophosphate-dependent acetolactate synthase large subunit-like protein
MHGGDVIVDALVQEGVRTLFTLTGGHIAPILTAAVDRGVEVIDVRDEATAVFAADATSRLTGTPGVAVVTAGPGVTNTLTALQNATLAQSPLVLIGGAAATVLQGRGALQDIDQQAVVGPHVKATLRVKRVRDLAASVHRAARIAMSDVPGPVFVEAAVDLLYPESVVRDMYVGSGGTPTSMAGRATERYLQWRLSRLFAKGQPEVEGSVQIPRPSRVLVDRVDRLLKSAERPLLIVGSGAVSVPAESSAVALAVERLGVPTWLTGMARGLLGRTHALQMRHRRREALKEADLAILAGMPIDFRLGYGRSIGRSVKVVTVGRDEAALTKNRRPAVAVHADAGRFLVRLSQRDGAGTWSDWRERLSGRDAEREREIAQQAAQHVDPINPLHLLERIDDAMAADSVIVADGGDFVASASYILHPRGPLGWLDPGVFGTLGVGAGFSMAAQRARPHSEVWLIWGDGASGFGLVEFDTFVRHQVPAIAVIGNDAGWTQIAREQIPMLGSDVGTALAATDYHRVAEGFGAVGFLLNDPARIDETLSSAKQAASAGRPVLINALIGRTGFRKGSMSM